MMLLIRTCTVIPAPKLLRGSHTVIYAYKLPVWKSKSIAVRRPSLMSLVPICTRDWASVTGVASLLLLSLGQGMMLKVSAVVILQFQVYIFWLLCLATILRQQAAGHGGMLLSSSVNILWRLSGHPLLALPWVVVGWAVTFEWNVLLDLSGEAATKTFSLLKVELLLQVLC